MVGASLALDAFHIMGEFIDLSFSEDGGFILSLTLAVSFRIKCGAEGTHQSCDVGSYDISLDFLLESPEHGIV